MINCKIIYSKFAIVILLLCPAFLFSQTISGRVYDKKNGKPLAYANVFLASTTLGDATDKDGHFIIRRIPPGSYRIVVTMMGYETQEKEIVLSANEKKTVLFELKPMILKGKEVVVTAKYPKEWKKKLKIFERIFFGLGPYAKACKLINPEVLDFSYDPGSGHFEATAVQPIKYINKKLGYEVTLLLEKYEADLENENLYHVEIIKDLPVLKNAGYSCVGELKFKELTPQSSKENMEWQKNRLLAYRGSFRHFLVSLYYRRLKKEGFEIWGAKDFSARHDFKIKPKDILQNMPASNQKILTFKEFLKVIYKRETDQVCEEMRLALLDKLQPLDEAAYNYELYQIRRDCAHQISWLRLNDAVGLIFNAKGNFLAKNIEFYGYWKWVNLSESLPADYVPILHQTSNK